MDDLTKKKVDGVIEDSVTRTFERIKRNFTHRPFHEALLSKEMVLASSFERSFSTSFGQGAIEIISELIALDNGFKAQRQKVTDVNVYKGAIDEIERICSGLRSGEKKPNWNREVEKIQAYIRGDTEIRRVISDLWIEKNGVESYISIKTVKPNLDQTEIAKKDLLLLKAHNPAANTFFALYYNPGGAKKADYNWSIPFKIFDLHNDSSVLIGEEYWDFIGGSGTYKSLLEIFENVGLRTRKKFNSV